MTTIVTDLKTFLITLTPLDIKGGQWHPKKTSTTIITTSIIMNNTRRYDVGLLSSRRFEPV
jgi:hypothetical protein